MIYEFKKIATGDIIEVNIRITEYDQYVKDHPELERYIGTAPAVSFEGRMYGGGHGVETRQPETFKEVLAKIGEHHPASPLAERYRKNKSTKEIKTKQAVDKSRQKTARIAKENAERRKRGGGVRAN